MLMACFVAMCLAIGPGAQVRPAQTDRVTLEGWVEDTAGRMPGALVHLIELGREAVTGADGRFSFTGLPPGTFTLTVHLPGYASANLAVTVPGQGPLAVRLEFDWRVQEEVTVTATPWATRAVETASTTASVDVEDVRRTGDASLGKAIDAIPGVANIPTGDALGTPVIRGISESRIRVLNDGVPLNHQQFSFRHSPNVEPALADRVEVVRGPASVLYGPEAVGGVINLVQAPLPIAHGATPALHGQAMFGYGANGRERSGQALVEGALGRFGWRAGIVRRDAGDLRTPDGPLPNTSFSQTNGLATAGYTGTTNRIRVRWHHWSDLQGFYQPAGLTLDLADGPASGWNSFVRSSAMTTRNRRTGARLPQTPPDRLDLSVRVRRDRFARLIDPCAAFDVVLVGRGRVSGPDEPFGTPTSPYALLNAHAGVGCPVGAALLRLDLVARNLLNLRYKDFLWTYKPWALSPGRDLRVMARVAF